MGNKLLFGAVYLLCALFLLSPGFRMAASTPDPAPIRPDEPSETSAAPPNSSAEQTSPAAEDTAAETDPESSSASLAEPDQTVSVYLSADDTAVEMTLDDYITRVVMAEVPYTFHPEALKAQAVAARSYCLYRMTHGTLHGDTDAGICTDYAHCMAYFSQEQAAERWGEERAQTIYETVRAAVEATSGEYLTWEGKVILALFHSSSTGKTENAENVWGSPYPYLVAVESPEEPRVSEVSVTVEELMALLREKGEADFSAALWGEENKITLSFNNTGRIAKLTMNGYTVKGTTLRTALGLRSTDFTADIQDGSVLFTVTGYGHGIGMSQYGAEAMAQAGATYREILAHYYTGTTLT